MNKEQIEKLIWLALTVIVTLAGIFGYNIAVVQPLEAEHAAALLEVQRQVDELAQGEVSFSTYNTACYKEQGGSKWVCGDGGEMEFQSGAILDVQSGATFSPTLTGLTVDGVSYVSSTAAITISGVLTNVNLIYYQN